MHTKLIDRRKNENASARRTRVVCFYNKETFNKITYGSKITVKHGADFHNDHHVIDVFTNGEFVGHVIHRKKKGDKLCNVCNNDEIIHLIKDDMVVNLVEIRDYQLLIDIPIKHKWRR